jgi:hypothetical protein
MGPEDLDEVLARAGRDPIHPELLKRISDAILPGLQPVRQMPSVRVLAAGLLLICAAVGIGGASIAGLHGFQKLTGVERAAIFAVLGMFAWLAAGESAAEMIPGSRRMVSPTLLVWAGCAVVIGLFAMLFSGYGLDGFVPQGIPCLRAGLLHALPTAGAAWFILRRGFAVDPMAAGLAAGTLAGLAGVIMLELHCGNLLAIHVMAWHVAVIPVSAAAGALLARALTSRERSAARPS